eukprot:gene21756-24672_t
MAAVPKARGLWDSDDEDAVLRLDTAKTAKAKQQTRSKPSLFDSGDEDDIFAPKASTTHAKKDTTLFDSVPNNDIEYEKLYMSELTKRKELEVIVAKLQDEVAALKLKLLQTSVSDVHLTPAPSVEESKDAEWEALAREEKLRRQRAIQQKATRQRTTTKRPAGAATALTSTVIDASTGNTDAQMVLPTERVPQVGHYLDSDEGEDTWIPSNQTTSEVPDMHTAASHSPVIVEEGGFESDKPASSMIEEAVTEDPETVKWRELAAQEKARKALARRSVRVVRRGGASGSNSAAEGVTGDGVVKHKHLLLSAYTQIKSSGSLQNLTVASSTPSTSTATTDSAVPVRSSHNPTSYPSTGNKSQDHFDSESDWDTNSQSEDSDEKEDSSNGGGAALRSGCGSPCPDSITAAEEAVLDRRLRTWASGKSIAHLLCTLPTVVELATQELLVSGDITTAAETLSVTMTNSGGQDVSGDIRKTY